MINVYIVEDGAMARMALKEMILHNGYQLVGSSASAEQAIQEIRRLDVDIALLDINLSGARDGISLGKQLRKELDCALVFLTAYGDPKTIDAIHSMEADGYVRKPYNETTVVATMQVALRKRQSRNQGLAAISDDSAITITESGHQYQVLLNQVRYMSSEGNYVHVITPDRTFRTRRSLSALLEEMDSERFVRIHQRFAINLKYLNSFTTSSVTIGDEILSISRSYQRDFKALLDSM